MFAAAVLSQQKYSQSPGGRPPPGISLYPQPYGGPVSSVGKDPFSHERRPGLLRRLCRRAVPGGLQELGDRKQTDKAHSSVQSHLLLINWRNRTFIVYWGNQPPVTFGTVQRLNSDPLRIYRSILRRFAIFASVRERNAGAPTGEKRVPDGG